MANVTIVKGDTWTRTWLIRTSDGLPVNLTGCTIRLHVRNASDALILNASTANGKITFVAVDGRINMTIPKEDTVSVTPGNYNFDIEVTFPTGVRRTYEQGQLTVLPDYAHD